MDYLQFVRELQGAYPELEMGKNEARVMAEMLMSRIVSQLRKSEVVEDLHDVRTNIKSGKWN